jgi:hypothetical protein
MKLNLKRVKPPAIVCGKTGKIPFAKVEDDGKWIKCFTDDFGHGRDVLRKYLRTHPHKGKRISLLLAGDY